MSQNVMSCSHVLIEPLIHYHFALTSTFDPLPEECIVLEVAKRISLMIVAPIAYIVLSSLALLGALTSCCESSSLAATTASHTIPSSTVSAGASASSPPATEQPATLYGRIKQIKEGYEHVHHFDIRQATTADLQLIETAIRRINASLPDWDEDTNHILNALRNHPEECSIAVADDGNIIGYTIYKSQNGHLDYIAVDEAERGKNIGTALMLSTMMKAIHTGKATFQLYYESNIESSRHFYEEKIPRLAQVQPTGRMRGHYSNGNPMKQLIYPLNV